MHLPILQQVLWGGTFSGEVLLFSVLAVTGRWKGFPTFTFLMSYHIFAELVTLFSFLYGSPIWINRIYWTYVLGDFFLQLAVVFELTRIVLRPTGTWVQDARTQFIITGSCGCLVALLCAWMVSPPTLSAVGSLELRGNLFTSLLVLELFVAMTMASNRLGLGWRNHVMAIAQGLTFCSVISCVVDALHNYLGEVRDYDMIDNVRSAAYGLALVYWIVQFWRPEPVRQPISPELRKYIADLHDRVLFDLDRVR